MNLLEKYISPWALPQESIVGRVRWTPNKDLRKIQLKYPKGAEISLPTVRTWEEMRNSVAFNIEELEFADKLTFLSKITTSPKKAETKTSFSISFFDHDENLLSEETLQTRIIRPVLVIENISPKRIRLTENQMEAWVKLELRAVGWGDILKIRPEIEVDASFLDIVQFKPTFITEANPFLEMNVEKYLDRLIVKKSGKTTLSMSFIYEDRIGNIYKTAASSIAIFVQRTVGVTPEILVENRVSVRNQERIISPPKEARLAWPLQA